MLRNSVHFRTHFLRPICLYRSFDTSKFLGLCLALPHFPHWIDCPCDLQGPVHSVHTFSPIAFANILRTLCLLTFRLRNGQSHLCRSQFSHRIRHPYGTFCLHGLLFLASTSLIQYFSLPLAPPQVKIMHNFVESLSVCVTFFIITTSYRRHSCNSPATSDDPILNSRLPFQTFLCHLHLDHPNVRRYFKKKKTKKKGERPKSLSSQSLVPSLPPCPLSSCAPLLLRTVRQFWINFTPPEDSRSLPTLIICVAYIRLPKWD